MSPHEIEEYLARTLDDRRLSRGERQALSALATDGLGDEERAAVCRQAFALARANLSRPEDGQVIDWLEAVVKAVQQRPAMAGDADEAEACFSPDDACPRRIARLFDQARRSADVCVFTITDDRITTAILDAHHRGLSLRIITDNDKACDQGSDIDRLLRAGVAVRVDHSPYHMHHKFAIFDETRLMTGSYNWTRGASEHNEENFVILGDRRLITTFTTTFERLWSRLGTV